MKPNTKKSKRYRIRKCKFIITRIAGVTGICVMISATVIVGKSLISKANNKYVSAQENGCDISYSAGDYAKVASVSNKKREIDADDELGQQLLSYVDRYPDIYTILENRQDYPDEVLNMFVNNQETIDFILDYPKEYNKEHSKGHVSQPEDGSVPLYIQWDEQWGYNQYGNNIIAISGCGPTALSMVASALLKDASITPDAVASFSQEQGYCTEVGTDWRLMSEGAQMLGLSSDNIPLSEEVVKNKLNNGNPVICTMGPGDFTTCGHFIVLTSYDDGFVTVNDPNSKANSKMKWKFSDIQDQIKNLWAFS